MGLGSLFRGAAKTAKDNAPGAVAGAVDPVAGQVADAVTGNAGRGGWGLKHLFGAAFLGSSAWWLAQGDNYTTSGVKGHVTQLKNNFLGKDGEIDWAKAGIAGAGTLGVGWFLRQIVGKPSGITSPMSIGLTIATLASAVIAGRMGGIDAGADLVRDGASYASAAFGDENSTLRQGLDTLAGLFGMKSSDGPFDEPSKPSAAGIGAGLAVLGGAMAAVWGFMGRSKGFGGLTLRIGMTAMAAIVAANMGAHDALERQFSGFGDDTQTAAFDGAFEELDNG